MIEKDVLVIGAGPGGSTTAKECAKRNIDTLLIEKRQEIGSPIRCAEGVGKKVEDYVEIKNDFVSKDVVGAKIFSPKENFFEMSEEVAGNEVGYILDRKRFDRYLVEKAIEEGTEVKLRTRAKDLSRSKEGIKTSVKRNGEEVEVKSKIVVAADGVESRIGQMTGLINSLDLTDVVSCAQYLVTDIEDLDLDYTYFYLGKELAPGGYAWIFPKGDKEANVGLGVQPKMAEKRPREYLDFFLKKLGLEQGNVLEEMFGAVPVALPLEQAIEDNLLLVGDAARQSDPITGGGIINAINAGKLAAQAIEEAFEQNDFSKNSLELYEEARKEEIAEGNKRNYHLKELFQSLSNKQYDSIITSLEGTEFEKLSVQSIVTKLLKESPEIAKKIDDII